MRSVSRLHTCKPRTMSHESHTQNGLAYTPAQMMAAADMGVPISTHNLPDNLFFDGVQGDLSFDIPIDMKRGVDIADCWESSRTAKKKAKKGLKNDIRVFGQNPQSV